MKGEALEKICQLSGCTIDECLAIGDNGNDLDMLKVAGISACPSNAVDYIKEVVDYISPVHCKDGAVGEIIEHFVFNDSIK